MSVNEEIKTTPSGHHKNPLLKKQVTYSSSMDRAYEKNLNLNSYIDRTNSLVTNEERLDDINEAINGDPSHDYNNGANASAQTIGSLHRTSEVENLAEKLLEEQDNLSKSTMELRSHHAHLKRTYELDNLNEINNDE